MALAFFQFLTEASFQKFLNFYIKYWFDIPTFIRKKTKTIVWMKMILLPWYAIILGKWSKASTQNEWILDHCLTNHQTILLSLTLFHCDNHMRNLEANGFTALVQTVTAADFGGTHQRSSCWFNHIYSMHLYVKNSLISVAQYKCLLSH